MYLKKIRQFLSSSKKMHTKEIGSFFLPQVARISALLHCILLYLKISFRGKIQAAPCSPPRKKVVLSLRTARLRRVYWHWARLFLIRSPMKVRRSRYTQSFTCGAVPRRCLLPVAGHTCASPTHTVLHRRIQVSL